MRKLIYFPKLYNKSAYLDSSGSSLKFKSFILSVSKYYKEYSSFNSHSFLNNPIHNEMKEVLKQTKELLSELLNCEKEGLFFIPSFSYFLNFLSLSLLQKEQASGEKILLTKLEHSSNVYPWIKTKSNREIKIDYVEIKNDFSIDYDDLVKKIDSDVKIFSFCHISNNVGVKNDVQKIVEIVREKSPSCIIIIDGSQSISSEQINLKKWGVDIFSFSCHKFYGPTGIGVAWMSKRARKFFPEIFWGGGKKIQKENFDEWDCRKFEVGSLAFAQIFGLREVLLTFKSLNLKNLKTKRKKILEYALKKLNEVESLKIYNKKVSDSIILFNLESFHSHDVANFLAKKNVYVRSGNFCTPFFKDLTMRKSAIRVSIALYTTKKEIDLLVNSLKAINNENIF